MGKTVLTTEDRYKIENELIPKALKQGLHTISPQRNLFLMSLYFEHPTTTLRWTVPELIDAVYDLMEQEGYDLPPKQYPRKTYSQSPVRSEESNKKVGECLEKYNIPDDLRDLGVLTKTCMSTIVKDCGLHVPPGTSPNKDPYFKAVVGQIAEGLGRDEPEFIIQREATKGYPCLKQGDSNQRPSRPATPAAPRPGGPATRPGGPAARPGGPVARPGGPAARPGAPASAAAARPGSPAARLGAPASAAAARPGGAAQPSPPTAPGKVPMAPPKGRPPLSMPGRPPGKTAQPVEPVEPARVQPPFRSIGYQVEFEGTYSPQLQRVLMDPEFLDKIENMDIRESALILSQLEYRDLIKLCQESQKLNYICSESNLWTNRLRSEFPGVKAPQNVSDRDLYQYLRFLKERRAKAFSINETSFPYTYDSYKNDIIQNWISSGEIEQDESGNVQMTEELENYFDQEYKNNLLGAAQQFIQYFPNLRRGDIVKFDVTDDETHKLIYNGKEFQFLDEYGRIPREFLVIDEFPILYWSEVVENPTVYFDAKPYINQILDNPQDGPDELSMISEFQHKNGIPIQIIIQGIDIIPTPDQIRTALLNGQFSHVGDEEDPDDDAWRTLLLEVGE